MKLRREDNSANQGLKQPKSAHKPHPAITEKLYIDLTIIKDIRHSETKEIRKSFGAFSKSPLVKTRSSVKKGLKRNNSNASSISEDGISDPIREALKAR